MSKEDRSNLRIVRSGLGVKTWIAHPPTVDDVRPGCCPVCEAASRPVGGGLGLWGHGLVARQLCGPLVADGEPAMIDVLARRYLRVHCGAVLVVVPLIRSMATHTSETPMCGPSAPMDFNRPHALAPGI